MFYEVLIILILTIISIWIILKWKIRHLTRATKHIPEVDSYPIIGCTHIAFGRTLEEIYDKINETLKNSFNGPIKSIFGTTFIVAVSNVEDVHTITHSPNAIEKHYIYDFLFKKGLLAKSANIWKKDRKILNSTFNLKILKSFIPVFLDTSKIFITKLEKQVQNGEFDVIKFTFPFTLDTVCRTVLGYNLDIQNNNNTDFLNSLHEFLGFVSQRIINVWHHLDFIYQKSSLYKKESISKFKMNKISQKIITLKRKEYNEMLKEGKVTALNPDETYKTPQIFVNELFNLSNEKIFSDEDIQYHVNTMLAAGTETSAKTIGYVLLMLGNHPEIQDRAYQEVLEKYSRAETVDFTTLSNLVYLEMVIKETLRLYPIGPYIGRHATGDIKLSNNTILPAGVSILVSFYHLHRNPNVWGPNAEIFNPDNFLPENMNKRHPSAFGGFSLGPRICIGYRYAMMSMKVVLAEFLMAYKVNTSLKPEQFRHTFNITLTLMNGYNISIENRIENK